jgi:hypothetical protein
MEKNPADLIRNSADLGNDDLATENLDLALASGYFANSIISLQITEEFAATDQEGH